MLAQALALTTGDVNARKAVPSAKDILYIQLKNPGKEKKSRLFVEGLKELSDSY
jgi:hypothetical protein